MFSLFEVGIKREFLAESRYFFDDSVFAFIIFEDSQGNQFAQEFHFFFTETTSGQCGCTDTKTTGNHGTFSFIRNCILVSCDVDIVQSLLQYFTVAACAAQVDQEEVGVCAAGDEVNAMFIE